MSRSTSRPTGTSRAIRVAVKLQSEKTKQCRWIAMLWSRCCWRQNLQADALLTTPPKNVDLLSFSWTKRPRQNSSVWRTCRSTNWDLEQSGIDSQKSGFRWENWESCQSRPGQSGIPLRIWISPLQDSLREVRIWIFPLHDSLREVRIWISPLQDSP